MARQIRKRQPKAASLGMQTDCTALYIRVSTDKQAEEGYSLEAQRAKLEALCTANGWRLCDDHLYTDAGESAKSADRPAYQRMITAVGEGAVNRVVVTKLDRLSRNTRDFLELLDYCDRHTCAIVSIAEAFDTGTPVGRAVVTVLMAFAELERTQITARVMSGKRQKAADGGFNGGGIPYGYTYQDGQFAINARQADVIRSVFDAFLHGSTMKDVAIGLNDTGTPTARGGKWDTSTVRYILRNGAYAGLLQWDGVETLQSPYPAIVAPSVYEAATRRLRALKPGPIPKSSQ